MHLKKITLWAISFICFLHLSLSSQAADQKDTLPEFEYLGSTTTLKKIPHDLLVKIVTAGHITKTEVLTTRPEFGGDVSTYSREAPKRVDVDPNDLLKVKLTESYAERFRAIVQAHPKCIAEWTDTHGTCPSTLGDRYTATVDIYACYTSDDRDADLIPHSEFILKTSVLKDAVKPSAKKTEASSTRKK